MRYLNKIGTTSFIFTNMDLEPRAPIKISSCLFDTQ